MFCVCRFGSGSGPIIFSEVTCDESDNHILRCVAVGFSSLASLCTHNDDVAVVCCKSFSLITLCLCNESDHLSTKFRAVNSNSVKEGPMNSQFSTFAQAVFKLLSSCGPIFCRLIHQVRMYEFNCYINIDNWLLTQCA